MGSSYIPTSDLALLIYLKNFAFQMTSDPAKFAQTPDDAMSVQQAVDAYEAAYLLVSHPDTKNPVTTLAKDEARNLAEQLVRQYANMIKHNSGISNADKLLIGVRPVNPSRSRILGPNTSPLLNIVGATPGSQTVRYADSMDPENRGKPAGVTQLQLFRVIAPDAVEGVEGVTPEFYGTFTRNPIGVEFEDGDDGQVVTYFARWATATGLVGPWSLPVSMRIAA